MIEEPLQAQVDDLHLHPAKTGHRLVDLVLALSAIAISVISLIVAVEHGRTERQLVASNSWPFIELHRDQDASSFSLKLEDHGVGPAHVFSLKGELDGRPVKNLSDLLSQCCQVTHASASDFSNLGVASTGEPRGVLSPREQIDFCAGCAGEEMTLSTKRSPPQFRA